MTEYPDSLDGHLARPAQTLGDHLEGVVQNVQHLLPATATTAYGDDWLTIGSALAWTHDAGKLTEYFADYLDTGDRGVADRPEYTYHGFVSGLLAAHVLYALDVSKESRLAGFYAVAKHHSVIPTLPADHDNYTSAAERVTSRYEVVRAQLQSIDQYADQAADDLLRIASDDRLCWEDIHADDPSVYKRLLQPGPEQFDDRFYETVLRTWSTLVCADKLDAADIELSPTTHRPPVTRLREHVDSLPDGETDLLRSLNELRSSAHEEAATTLLREYDQGHRFFRLTLPTGFGKTLTGLRAGLELAEQRDGRVIYALPYTSILDQVDGVCQDSLGVEHTDPEYTIHHHLADTRTNLSETRIGDNVSDGSESLYAEVWQSGLVLTTFTQLFESLAGPGNTQSMKLPALQDSVIVLDEPQAISLNWWGLVSRLTQFVTREYDATVVLMTATQPRILEESPETPDPRPLTQQTEACTTFLMENPRVEFGLHSSLARHLERRDEDTVDFETAAQTLLNTTPAGSNTLGIVNTIESAATLTEALSQATTDDDTSVNLATELCEFYRSQRERDESLGTVASSYLDSIASDYSIDSTTTLIATLTTRIRPTDRALLLTALRQILNDDVSTPFDDCRTVAVSTQLIEAGVDVSFDKLYRDFAPVPAIVQAAGRCNREYEGEVSQVTIWRLADPKLEGAIPSNLVYGRQSLLRPTRRALRALLEADSRSISEATMISDGIARYYEALHEQRQTSGREDSLATKFDLGDGEHLRRASLIQQEYATQDFLVLVSEEDVEQFENYQLLRENGEWTEASNAFTELKQLVVTLPVDEEAADDHRPVCPVDLTKDVDRYELNTGRGLATDHIALDTER